MNMTLRKCIFTFLFIILIAVACNIAVAENPNLKLDIKNSFELKIPNLKKELSEINEKIKRQEQEFLELKNILNILKKQLIQNENNSKAMQRETDVLMKQISELQNKYNQHSKELEFYKKKLNERLANFKSKFKNVYHLTSNESNSFLLFTTFSQQIPDKQNSKTKTLEFDEGFYIKKIFANDIKSLNEFRNIKSEIIIRQLLLDVFLFALISREKTLEKGEETLRSFSDLKQILTKLEAVIKVRFVKLIHSSKEERNNLEKIISELTNGSKNKKFFKKQDLDRASLSTHPYSLNKITIDKSSQLPLMGSIVQKFGNNRIAETSFSFKSKGIEIVSNTDRNVKCFDDGKIKFIGEIPLIGQTIIVEHSNQMHTIYGKLEPKTAEDELQQKKGDFVKKGAIIGLASQEAGQSRLYFEIRKNGVALNPLSVFKE